MNRLKIASFLYYEGIRGIVWRDRGVVDGWQLGSIVFQFAV